MKARRGDRAAFAHLMFRYRPRVWRQALRVCKNHDDAEDVMQDTWVYAFGHLADVREPHHLGAWLGTVALHCALDFRRRRATRTIPPFWGRMMPAPIGYEDVPEPDTNRFTVERLTVLAALDTLPEPLRETVTIFYFDAASHEEIARIHGVPINTVRSRLARAKRLLRHDLETLFPEITKNTMPVIETNPRTNRTDDGLTDFQRALITAAFPNDRIVSVEKEPEAWMPIEVRAVLETPSGSRHSVDIHAWCDVRTYMGEDQAEKTRAKDLALTPVLARLGLPVPELLAPPQLPPDKPSGSYVALTRTPRGENLLTWTLSGNTPHRIRAATSLGIEAIDRLHSLTAGLLADPVGTLLPRRTLRTDLDAIIGRGGPWLDVPPFADALTRLAPVVDAIAESAPLVYTNDLYFPNFLRVGTREAAQEALFGGTTEDGWKEAPFGWPGDTRLPGGRQITEYVLPWGWLGDPLLGLAKFWTYDCYPFVHTGFVERYLYEKGFTARDLAPRLAVRALWTLQREVSPTRTGGAEANTYRDSLEGLLHHAMQQL